MKRKRVISELGKLEQCRVCGKYFPKSDCTKGIPKHKNHDKKCSGTGDSGGNYKYEVTTQTQAQQLANLIIKDNGDCLEYPYGHTMACGDGKDCHEERQRWAKALAEYFLNNYGS